MFESKNDFSIIDTTLVVSAPKESCIKRVINRDSCSSEIATKKYDSQMNIKEKEKLADIVIYNNTNLEDLKNKTKEVYQKLISDLVKKS